MRTRLLRYKSHAEYRLPYRIAESVTWVESTIATLTQAFLPLHRKRFDRNLSKKKEVLVKDGREVQDLKRVTFDFFDKLYHDRLLDQERHIKHEEIKEDYPLKYTLHTFWIFTPNTFN
ncbi:hypothetical protein VCV18_000940 [Metarhizium anisopliae]